MPDFEQTLSASAHVAATVAPTAPPTITEFLIARIDEDEVRAHGFIVDAMRDKDSPSSFVDATHAYATRALREATAKRRIILGELDPGHDHGEDGCPVCVVLVTLAAIYSDHVDYDPAWSPGD